VQGETLAGLLKDLKGFKLGRRERRDESRVREAGERADIVRVPLCVDAGVLAALEIDDAGTDVFLLALGRLALAVEVPYWVCEGLEHVGALSGKGVVDVVG
jgi:hypothetical protein